MNYPIEKMPGTRGAVWIAWSLPIECAGRSAEGLETFATYRDARREACTRNLQLAIERGHADEPLPALDGGRGGSSGVTFREYYRQAIEG